MASSAAHECVRERDRVLFVRWAALKAMARLYDGRDGSAPLRRTDISIVIESPSSTVKRGVEAVR